jgi:hypothetical protein
MWPHAEVLAKADLPNAVVVSRFVDSLNQMFDLHSKRVTVGLSYRVPAAMRIVLFRLTVLVMLEVGYFLGLSDEANWPLALMLSLAFSSTIMLIADLDGSGVGKGGLIQIDPQPLLDLRRRVNE